MSREVRILERARADVDAIFNWLVRRSAKGAVSWYIAFRRALRNIAATPEAHSEAAESYRLGRLLRQALFKTPRGRVYRIIFAASDTEVIILRVRGPGQAPLRARDVPEP